MISPVPNTCPHCLLFPPLHFNYKWLGTTWFPGSLSIFPYSHLSPLCYKIFTPLSSYLLLILQDWANAIFSRRPFLTNWSRQSWHSMLLHSSPRDLSVHLSVTLMYLFPLRDCNIQEFPLSAVSFSIVSVNCSQLCSENIKWKIP